MVKLVTIKTFSLPHEAAIVMGRLESEGILCHLADSHIVQSVNLYSIGVGGVKIQVNESDAAHACDLLLRWGYLSADDVSPPDGKFLLSSLVKRFPALNRIPPIFLLLIVTALAVTLITLLVYALGKL